MEPRYFASPAAFRAWLGKNHALAPELLVGFHKVGSGRPSLTWPQSVDEALCFGWIDGVRRRAGRAAFEARSATRARTYSYERSEEPELEPALAKEFRATPKAWNFFQAQAPSWRSKVLHWIVGAKAAEVRRRRLRKVVDLCALGRRA